MRSLVVVLALGLSTTAHAGVAVGDPAPEFVLSGSDGQVHRLSDSVGQRAVVIAWFPKAFTPG